MTGYMLQVANNVCGVRGHNIQRLHMFVDGAEVILNKSIDLCLSCGMLLEEIRREKVIPEGNNAPSS